MKAATVHDSKLSSFLPFPSRPESPPQSLACLRVISQSGFTMRLYKGGRLLKLKFVGEPREPGKRPLGWLDNARASNIHTRQEFEVPESGHFGRPPRGAVRGFSPHSRSRLLQKFNMLDTDHCTPHPKFITLTYPRELVPSWEVAKEQLNTFLWYLEKSFGRHGLMWRMEQQADSTLHFHILFWYKPFVSWRWVANAWDGLIVNHVLPEQSASTNIQGIRNHRQAAYYVSKYIAKATSEAEGDTGHGRHWGTRNWGLMPVTVRVVALALKEAYQVRRWMRRLRLSRGVPTHGFGRTGAYVAPRECGISLFAAEVDGWRMVHCATSITKAEYLRSRKPPVPSKVPCTRPRAYATLVR
jgi:hypothetical protein